MTDRNQHSDRRRAIDARIGKLEASSRFRPVCVGGSCYGNPNAIRSYTRIAGPIDLDAVERQLDAHEATARSLDANDQENRRRDLERWG